MAPLLGMWFILNFGDLAKFEAGLTGFKAEAKAARDDANFTIIQVRTLAQKVAKMGLSILGSEGRMGGMNDNQRLALKKEVEQALQELQLTTDAIRDATGDFEELYAALHVSHIVNAFFKDNGFPSRMKPVFGYTDYQEAQKDFVNRETGFRMPPSEVRRRLSAMAPLTPTVDELIKDYEYFLKEGKFRREENWGPAELKRPTA
jgi:hypothetical protein